MMQSALGRGLMVGGLLYFVGATSMQNAAMIGAGTAFLMR
jgi:hypothetical protein